MKSLPQTQELYLYQAMVTAGHVSPQLFQSCNEDFSTEALGSANWTKSAAALKMKQPKEQKTPPFL